MKFNNKFFISILILIIKFIYNNECGLVCYTKDPDENRDTGQLIESRGFKVQIDYVKTSDGYILAMHRIITKLKKTRPIILQHGLLSSSADWLINSPGLGDELTTENVTVGNNLGFTLALLGYDVWLADSRGNTYSTNHTTLDPKKDKKFWEFSFDEMIQYDLPAIIAHVRNATKQDKIGYIGHSQGTLIMFALLSEKPEYADIIEPFIALGPVTRVAHIRSPIRFFALNPLLMEYFYIRGGEFLPSNEIIKYLADKICGSGASRLICENIMFLFCGYDSEQLNKTRLPVYVHHSPAGTSSWNVIHFGQMYLSRKFCKFDYGWLVNLKIYGTLTPPEYDLYKIKSKHIALLSSLNDWLADPNDVDILRQQIQESLILDYVVKDKMWNHLDFLYGKEAAKYVNSIIVQLLEKYDREI